MTTKKTQQTPQTTETIQTLPMSVAEAAKLWGMSQTRVKILVDQGRVKHIKVGGSEKRTGSILVMQRERPVAVPPGTLSQLQRSKRGQKRGGGR